MTTQNSHSEWQREQETLERIGLEQPDLLHRPALTAPDQKLARVGITGLDPARPRGFLKYSPLDFVVEEVLQDGEIVTVTPERSVPDAHGDERRTLYCNLIKVNLSTLLAVQYLSEHLGLERKRIGYAGIKDAVAVTSQRISLRDVDWDAIKETPIPNVVLEPVKYGKGTMERGALKGNRFSVLIRTGDTVNNDRLREQIEGVQNEGFVNYFGLQRFGSRLEGAKLGCLLLRGDIDGCIKALLTDEGPFDLPLFRQVRRQMAGHYGDWAEMLKIAELYPYTLRREIRVMRALKKDSKKTINALRTIEDAVRLYIYGYGSWLTNRYLSDLRKQESMPEQIVQPLSDKKEDRDVYRTYFDQDGVPDDFLKHLKPFSKTVNIVSRTYQTRVKPEFHRVTKVDPGVAFSFSLPKGSYATTLLMHFFQLYEGLPVPGWVNSMDVDSMKAMRVGDLGMVRERLAPFLHHD